ncbi:3-HEXULOSE-6-PHOSPHATE ISOMERASE [Salix viminalis]|uniref:3-HEXULOSE-6-PHOSPHATE ISOMERASE n=1 Tax=Salix viminalis TaxID=40686 RepID=A0A9Q0SGN5_SALVM|nr:3-HEXULOSE-6-PHOSPHATE ISOMERASE [Salix viminalis]
MGSEPPSMSSLASQICNHIASIFAKPTDPRPPPLDIMVTTLTSTAAQNGRVFLYGVGREGLMLKALCMRLSHLGISTHFVFDMTAPPITSNDLLVASAGPGGFSTVDALCSLARSHGATVLLLTAQPETGSCVKHASVVCHVPAQTMADDKGDGDGDGDGEEEKSRPLMPMGSVYEGGPCLCSLKWLFTGSSRTVSEWGAFSEMQQNHVVCLTFLCEESIRLPWRIMDEVLSSLQSHHHVHGAASMHGNGLTRNVV